MFSVCYYQPVRPHVRSCDVMWYIYDYFSVQTLYGITYHHVWNTEDLNATEIHWNFKVTFHVWYFIEFQNLLLRRFLDIYNWLKVNYTLSDLFNLLATIRSWWVNVLNARLLSVCYYQTLRLLLEKVQLLVYFLRVNFLIRFLLAEGIFQHWFPLGTTSPKGFTFLTTIRNWVWAQFSILLQFQSLRLTLWLVGPEMTRVLS